MKRHLLACVILAVMTSAASAQISDNVVRIGVLTDLSSWGRDNSGLVPPLMAPNKPQ